MPGALLIPAQTADLRTSGTREVDPGEVREREAARGPVRSFQPGHIEFSTGEKSLPGGMMRYAMRLRE